MSIYNYHPDHEHMDSKHFMEHHKPHPIEHLHHDDIHYPHPMPHKSEPYNLINQYNRVCYKNYDEALSLLKNKHLLAGEVAFAYYFDRETAYGINSVAAVGSIKEHSANIIFDNKEEIDRELIKLSKGIDNNTDELNSYKSLLNNVSNKLNIVDEAINKHNELLQSIDSLNSNLNIINTSVNLQDLKIKQLNDILVNQAMLITNMNVSVGEVTNLANYTNTKLDEFINKSKDLHIAIKDELLRKFDASLTEYVDALITLKSDITKQIAEETLPLKSEIYDLHQDIDKLNTNIINTKAETISYVKDYIPLIMDNKLFVINSSISTINNNIHDLSDKIEDTSKYLGKHIDNVKSYVDIKIDAITTILNSSVNEINQELNKQRTYLKDSINSFKQEYNTLTDDKISKSNISLLDKINKLDNKLTTSDSEINAKISTINSTFDAYKVQVKDQITSQLGDILTNMRNYIGTAISDDRIYYDSIYARKDMIPTTNIGGAGIVINNGVISLNIDSNGVLNVNGKRYLLKEL